MSAQLTTLRCRWKRKRGEGLSAIYRASCGRTGCPGHLGDLSYVGNDVDSELARAREAAFLRVVARRSPSSNLNEFTRIKLLRAAEVMEVGGNVFVVDEKTPSDQQQPVRFSQGWLMSAKRLCSTKPQDAVYRGFRDSGYRITLGGKRSGKQSRVGRRPVPFRSFFAERDRYAIDGQMVTIGDRVWCPVCNTLNMLDWPEQQRDSQAQ